MRSEHPVESISAYLDDALEPEERRELERHLAECAACRGLLDDLRTLETAHEDPPPVPDGLRETIARRLEQGDVVPMRSRVRRRWYRSVPLAAAASLAAVAVLGVFLLVEPERVEDPAGLRDRRQVPLSQPSRPPAEKEEAGRDDGPVDGSTATDERSDDRKKGDLLSIGYLDSDTGNQAGAEIDDESDRIDALTEGAESAAAAQAPEEPQPEPEAVREQPAPGTFSPVPSVLEKQAVEEREQQPESEDKDSSRKAARESSVAEGRVTTLRQEGVRSILAEDPAGTITLFENGAMRIVSGDYDCSVTLPDGADEKVSALFASGAGRASPDQSERIRGLLDADTRGLFRKHCGPLPEALDKQE